MKKMFILEDGMMMDGWINDDGKMEDRIEDKREN